MPHSGRNFRKPIDIDGDGIASFDYYDEWNRVFSGIGDHGAWMRPDGFIEMYNDKLYEDYDFLQKHCSPEFLQKLQDAYPYDSEAPAYATWLSEAGSRTANLARMARP